MSVYVYECLYLSVKIEKYYLRCLKQKESKYCHVKLKHKSPSSAVAYAHIVRKITFIMLSIHEAGNSEEAAPCQGK